MTGADAIRMWHNLPMSGRREIAAKYGVPAQGVTPLHVWTMRIIDAAGKRNETEQLKADIAAAHARS